MATTEVEVIQEEQQQERNEDETSGKPRRRFGFNFKKDPDDKHARRPPDNKWLQQQIPACRPVFTALNAFVGFLIIGVAFLILGAVFTAFSSRLRQFEVFYENCSPLPSDVPSVRAFPTCEAYLEFMANLTNVDRRGTEECHCEVNFNLTEEMRPSWSVYYGIRNYYQNHRRYLNSWDVNHLRGESFTSPTVDCRPFIRLSPPDDPDADPLPVVPCGLIANSWFNDSFDSFTGLDEEGNNVVVTLNRTNIAWETDRTVRFRNPDDAENVTEDDLEGTIQPPSWLYNLSEIPQGLQNESLMVWFRVSAFPWFKKLYARPEVGQSEATTEMNTPLPPGSYRVVVTYNYPVDAFNGRKSIVLAEVNWLGGHNLFLGIAYLVVGGFLVIAAFALLLMHKLCSNWKLSKAPFNSEF